MSLLRAGISAVAQRFGVLDLVAVALFLLGVAGTATGLLTFGRAEATVSRILPTLLFLGTVIVLAELTAAAEVFDVVAARLAIIGRGSYPVLFLLAVVFASLTTIFLNLDTTTVLLTPVMLALAVQLRMSAVPLAMTTVWLSNTASLLLPVSNLTNLLAADRVALSPLPFASRMWAPQVASIAATTLFLWLFYWRRRARSRHADLSSPGGGATGTLATSARYSPPARHVPADPALFRLACGTCLAFVAGNLTGLPLPAVSTACALVLTLAFARRRRHALRWSMIPWRLLVFVTGLFLVVQTVSAHGLGDLVRTLVGSGVGPMAELRTAVVGGALSNVLNNLPAYVTVETVVPSGESDRLLALLIGTNVGPLITPWASLATLIWYERCAAYGVRVPLRTFVATGAVTTVVALPTATALLVLT